MGGGGGGQLGFDGTGTHVVVFCANASHALYPTEGRQPRGLGLADDATDARGLRWAPTHLAVWGPAMFPVDASSGKQRRPSLCVLKSDRGHAADELGIEQEAADPLLHLSFFRGKYGAQGGPGWRSTLPLAWLGGAEGEGGALLPFASGGPTRHRREWRRRGVGLLLPEQRRAIRRGAQAANIAGGFGAAVLILAAVVQLRRRRSCEGLTEWAFAFTILALLGSSTLAVVA